MHALKVWNAPISSKPFKKLQLCNFIALNKNDKNSNWFFIQPFIRCIPVTFLNYALTLVGNPYWDHVQCCLSVNFINFIQFFRDCVALSQQAINKVTSFYVLISLLLSDIVRPSVIALRNHTNVKRYLIILLKSCYMNN